MSDALGFPEDELQNIAAELTPPWEQKPQDEAAPATLRKAEGQSTAAVEQDTVRTAGEASAKSEATASAASRHERRSRRRAPISAPVRVRNISATDGSQDEISTTIDVSRTGILFMSSHHTFHTGMSVAVTFPYSKSTSTIHGEQAGRVTRVSEMAEGCRAIAVALGVSGGAETVDARGRNLTPAPSIAPNSAEPGTKKPLVLAMDADNAVREMLKTYLTSEGYDVITVDNSDDAREVLKMFTPVLLIAEIEGEGLPGYDLCVHVKANPRLSRIPVMLMTRSAYPSDYSSAHSLGAVVCIAKPFRQERLGHVVRLLAPPPEGGERPVPPRVADPSRKARAGNGTKARLSANVSRAHVPPWAK